MSPKTCVVTGSSRGIGRAIALRFGSDGWQVVVNYRVSKESAISTAEKIEESGGSATVVQADVTDSDDVEKLHSETHRKFDEIDVLVNNAGITQDSRFNTMSRKDWQSVIDVHLNGTYNCTRIFYDDISEANEGRLINISSIVGKMGNFGQANYAAANAGIIGFTRSLAIELAPEESTSNCIAPGFIATQIVSHLPDKIKERIISQTPVGRFGAPKEIAEVAAFLADDQSSFITGEVITVDGGKHLQHT